MSELIWEWTLASGENVSARVDTSTQVESVYVGQRLVSRSGQGGKPNGHVVTLGASASSVDGAYRAGSPQELLVKLDPAFMTFELRANGQLVAPASAPFAPVESRPGRVYGPVGSMRSAPDFVPAPQTGTNVFKIIAVVLVVLLVVPILAIFGVRKYIAARGGGSGGGNAGSLSASTGLATIHYPAGFKAEEATKTASGPAGRDDDCKGRTCTIQFSLLKLLSTSRDEGVFVASFKMNGLRIGRDPWRVSNLLHERFQDALKVHGTDYVEADRQDGTCFGEPGAVVTSRFRSQGEDGTMWTCTFIRDGNAYWYGTFVNSKNAADEPDLRKIVEASDISAAAR